MDTTNKLSSGALMLIMLFLLILSIITVAICFSIKNNISYKDSEIIESSDIPANANVKENDVEYIIRSNGSFIEIKNKNGEVIKTIQLYLELLPPTDKEALEKGIEVYNEEELASLVEDYS